LFQNLFTGHGIVSIRKDPTGDYAVLSLPWDTKIRKLLQNTLLIENNFKLSVSINTKQRNLNEVILHYVGLDIISQKILAVIHNRTKCYEIDIPMGTKMIMDNLIVKPHKITDDEKQELDDKYEEIVEINFELIRKQITSKQTTIDVTNFITINQIGRSENHYRIHVVGKFVQKGVVQSRSTRFGDSNKVTGILYDDTGEIRITLWGEITKQIQNDDILELDQAYSKKGILNNKQGGMEVIHKI
jgi:anion-transporting  ArsA/GET3 family ATPase